MTQKSTSMMWKEKESYISWGVPHTKNDHCLTCRSYKYGELGVMVWAYNPTFLEAKAERSKFKGNLSYRAMSRPTGATQ